jgi:hypothetical protein
VWGYVGSGTLGEDFDMGEVERHTYIKGGYGNTVNEWIDVGLTLSYKMSCVRDKEDLNGTPSCCIWSHWRYYEIILRVA